MLSPYINGTCATPIGELIAVKTDGKTRLKKILGVFTSCEGIVRGKLCLFHFLRAETKVKASSYDQQSLRNNYVVLVDAYLASSYI